MIWDEYFLERLKAIENEREIAYKLEFYKNSAYKDRNLKFGKTNLDVDYIINMLRGARITKNEYDRIRYVLDCCVIQIEEEEEWMFKNLKQLNLLQKHNKDKQEFIKKGEMEV